MRLASGSGRFEPSYGLAFGVGVSSWAAEGVRLVTKPEPAGVTAHGFVTVGFFPSTCDPRRGDFGAGGASEGGSTTSVWGGVEAGPECQVGFVESARLESEGARTFDPSCGAPSGVAIPRRYNPAAAKARQVDASMCLTRVIRTSHQLSGVSFQQEHRSVVGHRQAITAPFSKRNPLTPRSLSPKGERGGELIRFLLPLPARGRWERRSRASAPSDPIPLPLQILFLCPFRSHPSAPSDLIPLPLGGEGVRQPTDG